MDILERLKDAAAEHGKQAAVGVEAGEWFPIVRHECQAAWRYAEAADEIDALRAQLAAVTAERDEARESFRPLANRACAWLQYLRDTTDAAAHPETFELIRLLGEVAEPWLLAQGFPPERLEAAPAAGEGEVAVRVRGVTPLGVEGESSPWSGVKGEEAGRG